MNSSIALEKVNPFLPEIPNLSKFPLKNNEILGEIRLFHRQPVDISRLDLSHKAVVIYGYLSGTRYNPSKMTMERIALDIGISERSVKYALSELKNESLVRTGGRRVTFVSLPVNRKRVKWQKVPVGIYEIPVSLLARRILMFLYDQSDSFKVWTNTLVNALKASRNSIIKALKELENFKLIGRKRAGIFTKFALIPATVTLLREIYKGKKQHQIRAKNDTLNIDISKDISIEDDNVEGNKPTPYGVTCSKEENIGISQEVGEREKAFFFEREISRSKNVRIVKKEKCVVEPGSLRAEYYEIMKTIKKYLVKNAKGVFEFKEKTSVEKLRKRKEKPIPVDPSEKYQGHEVAKKTWEDFEALPFNGKTGLENVWRLGLHIQNDTFMSHFSLKDQAMFKSFQRFVGFELSDYRIMFERWRDLSDAIKRNAGLKSVPGIPNIAFCLKFRTEVKAAIVALINSGDADNMSYPPEFIEAKKALDEQFRIHDINTPTSVLIDHKEALERLCDEWGVEYYEVA